jgi:hypothetical protein
MKIEDQVCSLELARKLKDLGVKQTSFFVWVELYQGPYFGFAPFHRLAMSGENLDVEKLWSAPTVADLGEILPWQVGGKRLNFDKWQNTHRITYYLAGEHNYEQTADTEADARAKMLIYLLENDLLPAGELR